MGAMGSAPGVLIRIRLPTNWQSRWKLTVPFEDVTHSLRWWVWFGRDWASINDADGAYYSRHDYGATSQKQLWNAQPNHARSPWLSGVLRSAKRWNLWK